MLPFTIVTLTTGLILFIISLITIRFPPKKINSTYGYRTKASMRNQQTWEEANRYSSKLMLLCGGILTAIGLLSFFISFLSQANIVAGIVLTLLFSLMPIPLTERR